MAPNPQVLTMHSQNYLYFKQITLHFTATGTGSYKNTPCPLGYVCPMGSTQPVPCPPGTFGNITHGEKTEDCHPCPANTFNHLPAQKACFPCGSSSTSPAGKMLHNLLLFCLLCVSILTFCDAQKTQNISNKLFHNFMTLIYVF